jgi:hypothetical protein
MPDGQFRTAAVDVLPHQAEGLGDVTSDAILSVCGWGGGKTEFGAMKAVQLAGLNWPVPVAMYEPTYPMVRDILVPTFRDLFARIGIAYRYNKVDHDLFVRMRGRDHQIMLRSTDNAESLKGPNLAAIILDEAGLHQHDAWRYLPPRARHPRAPVKQFVAVGTPEGFGDFYEWAEGPWDEHKRGKRRVIRAQTYDNLYLQPTPEEYIRRKLSHLDEADLDQYVRGLFIARGSRVYRSFQRDINGLPCGALRQDRIGVGGDLNYGKTTWTLAAERSSEEAHVFGEVTRYETTTEDMGNALVTDLQKIIRRKEGRDVTYEEIKRRVTIYLDPSAKSLTVRAHKSDVTLLRSMGFDVQCNHTTIPVKDRVMSVNWRFREETGDGRRALMVDVAACPELAKSLEQQGRDKNGEPEKNKDPKLDLSGAVDSLGYYVWGHPHWRASVPQGNNEVRVSGYLG